MSGGTESQAIPSPAGHSLAGHAVDQVHGYQPGFRGAIARIEDIFGTAVLAAMALIPVVEAILRAVFRVGIPDANLLLRHLLIVVTFAGAALAAKEKRHLGMSFGLAERGGVIGAIASSLKAFVAGTVAASLVWASLDFAFTAVDPTGVAWFIPLVVFVAAMPLGLLIIIVRSFPSDRSPLTIGFYIAGIVASLFVSAPALSGLLSPLSPDIGAFFDSVTPVYYAFMESAIVPVVIVVILAAIAGAPLFIVLGGLPIFLFGSIFDSSVPVVDSAYEVLKDINMPAIALFTLAGFILSESKAGPRFVHLFQGLFGRLPGGVVIVTVLVCAFFTAITGASGITILALGAVLYKILTDSGKHGDKFAIGLLTGSDALGIVLPPSLAIILYASIAGADASTSILELFKAGLLPGLLMIIGTILVGVFIQRKLPKTKLPPMSFREVLGALKASALELLLPVIIVVAFFGGLANIIEASAMAVVYIFVIEVFVKKEIDAKAFLRLCVKSLVVVGGILIIVGCARGLSNYFVFAGVPQELREWAQANISSQLLFLLLLNLVFFISGAFMDIFSAILILVPLVVPLATVFGVNQYHLAIIFLTNHIVGFITPPMGFSLFLSAYRFERPLTLIYKSMIPYFIVQVAIVFVVTYVPWFTTVLLSPSPALP